MVYYNIPSEYILHNFRGELYVLRYVKIQYTIYSI